MTTARTCKQRHGGGTGPRGRSGATMLAGKPRAGGRPSQAVLAEREAKARRASAALLTQALKHLNHPSRLSESALCQLPSVRQQAAALQGCQYPRAQLVIRAVQQAYEAAWHELG